MCHAAYDAPIHHSKGAAHDHHPQPRLSAHGRAAGAEICTRVLLARRILARGAAGAGRAAAPAALAGAGGAGLGAGGRFFVLRPGAGHELYPGPPARARAGLSWRRAGQLLPRGARAQRPGRGSPGLLRRSGRGRDDQVVRHQLPLHRARIHRRHAVPAGRLAPAGPVGRSRRPGRAGKAGAHRPGDLSGAGQGQGRLEPAGPAGAPAAGLCRVARYPGCAWRAVGADRRTHPGHRAGRRLAARLHHRLPPAQVLPRKAAAGDLFRPAAGQRLPGRQPARGRPACGRRE